MMIRKLVSLLLAISLVLPLAGCWDRRELNELAISVAMGIDKSGSQYQVTVQVVQPGEVAMQKGGSEGMTPVTLYKAEGTTIFEAIRKMTTVSSRKIYAAHLRIIVIGEELAREGIGDALDILSRDYELRSDSFLLIAKGTTAAHTLGILTPLEKIPANKIYESIQTSEKVWAPVISVTLDKFINDIESKGKNPVISGIKVSGSNEKGGSLGNMKTTQPAVSIQNNGLAVFRKDRLIGWLNQEDSKGYNYILNNIVSTVGHVDCPHGGQVALEVIHSEAQIKSSFQNGRPRLAVELRTEQNVGEVKCQIDLTDMQVIRELEQQAEQVLQGILEHLLEVSQKKYKSDFIGFGNALHRSNPGEWRSLKTDWDEIFEDAETDVTVKVKIKRTGTVTNSFMEERE
ncbi:Ger(x)C family spore germination protein [Paenibacillus lupini]|uniref:Ger(x)C family spore germination protein n=1 Tax=Paenibacillus lupini TaxID=1450204 RepID=UPI00142496CB|nr:Ger(x)C family spore germination protein [Paenibacillus lupini]NIK22648.1 spore germination protein KC [Paenibacillus lupini]